MMLNPATMTVTDRRNDLANRLQQISTGVNETLSPKQIVRLRQIHRQVSGVGAFTFADVIQALALTDEQREAINRLTSGPGGHHGPPDGGGPPPQPFGKPFSRDDVRQREQTKVAKVVAQLSPQQQETWSTLLGEPFTGELSRDYFGPGAGPGGRGRKFDRRDGHNDDGHNDDDNRDGPRRDARNGPGTSPNDR
jgi:hypothetical protein